MGSKSFLNGLENTTVVFTYWNSSEGNINSSSNFTEVCKDVNTVRTLSLAFTFIITSILCYVVIALFYGSYKKITSGMKGKVFRLKFVLGCS